MARLIEIYEIDEFSEVKTIPDVAISKDILCNIRNLDEKDEMEQFIREILCDPNETPHGPTEIGDILTDHLHVRGDKRPTAFVLKGKGFQRISSRAVTHQFAKLRQIPNLDLMVFVAVGNIQDDARRDFIQTAIDAGCDYLIIDAQDLARLLITYEKICPKDGTPYDEMGTCKNGHARDKGLFLEMEVREKARYTIFNQRDVSHAGAKRYSATILLDRHYPREVIKGIIGEATGRLKYSNYYRNERVRAWWGKTPAHVVWLFIAYDLEDIQNANWACRAYWVDPFLREDMRPTGLNGNEKLGNIEILWNDEYKPRKEFLQSHQGTKEAVLEAIRPVLSEMVKLAKRSIIYFKKYQSEDTSEEEFISAMQKMEPKITELLFQSDNIPLPPEDCKDYDQACQNIFVTIHNMFLYYSKRGLEKWPRQNRDWLMQDTIKRFYDDWSEIEFEERKIH